MNIILFGPPGAGKGTQGDFLAKDLNLIKVSTGDLLRKEISTKSEFSSYNLSVLMENGDSDFFFFIIGELVKSVS